MSYLVLARKYRSKSFDDVVGQNHVAQTLKRAIESQRVAHAYLFCGTRGVGKTSMARILAKALNCESADAPTTTPCGKCASCQAIARGDDIDVIEIDAASHTGVDNVRDLIANAQFHPARSRFKVYIIDEVHMLSKQAFNALLKIMEEPPSHVKFILATTEPEKVLPTILSRCQRYDFRNIPTREIAAHLGEICKSEKIKADDEALLLIAKAGAGSMRDALSLLDRLLSYGEKNLSVQMIEQLLGMPRSHVMFDLVESIGQMDLQQVLQSTDAQLNMGMSADTLVAGLIDHFRNLLIIRTCGADSTLVEVPGLMLDDLAKQAQRFEPASLSQNIAILEELRRNLRTSVAGRALLDATLARMALAGQFTPLEQLLQGIDGAVTSAAARSTPSAAASPALKKNVEQPRLLTPSPSPLAGGERSRTGEGRGEGPGTSKLIAPLAQQPSPSPLPQAGEAPESNLAPVLPDDLDGIWRTLIDLLSAKGHGLPALLQGARLVGIEDGTAVVSFSSDHDAIVRMLDRNGKKDAIRKVLAGLLKQDVALKFELEPAPLAADPQPPALKPRATAIRRSPPPPQHAEMPSTPARLTPQMKEVLRADPLIAAVIEHLGAEIVKVE